MPRHDRLGRAYLNRAHDALHAGLPDLARRALFKGFECSSSVIKAILVDPRLCVEMAALVMAPRLAASVRPSVEISDRRDRADSGPA